MTFHTVDTTSASATEKRAAEAIAYEPRRGLMFAVLVCSTVPRDPPLRKIYPWVGLGGAL
jgi:hypothetical protein